MVTLHVCISNSTIFTVNATNNYWEARAGLQRELQPSATGSPVTANVTFSPWWTTSNGLLRFRRRCPRWRQWRGERELDGARALRDEQRHIASTR